MTTDPLLLSGEISSLLGKPAAATAMPVQSLGLFNAPVRLARRVSRTLRLTAPSQAHPGCLLQSELGRGKSQGALGSGASPPPSPHHVLLPARVLPNSLAERLQIRLLQVSPAWEAARRSSAPGRLSLVQAREDEPAAALRSLQKPAGDRSAQSRRREGGELRAGSTPAVKTASCSVQLYLS